MSTNTVYKGDILPFSLQAGDVIMFRSTFSITKPSSYPPGPIRKATNFPYNHSGIITESNGELYINEAIFEGVVKRPLSEKWLDEKRKTENFIGVLRPKVPVDPVAVSIRADKFLGVKYDFNALVVHHLLYRLPRTFLGTGEWKGSTNDRAIGKLVCSELVQLVHNRPKFWLSSTREVFEDSFYDFLWEEKKLLGNALLPSWE